MRSVRVLQITPNGVQRWPARQSETPAERGCSEDGCFLQAAVGALPETVPQGEVGVASLTLTSCDPPGDLG